MVKVHDGGGVSPQMGPLNIALKHVDEAFYSVEALKPDVQEKREIVAAQKTQVSKAKSRMSIAFAVTVLCGAYHLSNQPENNQKASFGFADFALLSSLGASFLAAKRKADTQSKLDVLSDDLEIQEARLQRYQGRHSMASQISKDIIMNLDNE